MSTDPAMLQEAIQAARMGDRRRARDLLTRLLRMDKDHPDHWLWMSAVVETRQEQIYCLQNLLRVDPENLAARRGLIMMGALDAHPEDVQPVLAERKHGWTVSELALERPRGWRAIMANPAMRWVVYLAAAALTLSLVGAGVFGIGLRPPATPTPDFAATAAAVGKVVTLTPTTTATPSPTPAFRTPTPTPGKPTPLAYFLDATYTPTPLYVATSHAQTEAFRLGMRARDRQDWEAVVDFMQQSIAVVEDAADMYYYLGDAYLHLDDAGAALDAFNTAIELDENFGPAYLGRALAQSALDSEADIAADLNRAITLSSDFGLAYLERARYAIAQGDFIAAEEDLVAAEVLLPGSPLVPYLRALSAFEQNDLDEALRQAQLAHDADFTDLPTYLLLGQIELARGELVQAATWLKTYTRYQPDDLTGLSMYAQVLAQSGEVDEAIGIFDVLLEEETDNPELFLGRGLAYLAAGDHQAALADLNRANRLDRNNFSIMLALGRALLEAGDPGDAFVQLSDTLAIARDEREQGLVLYFRAQALLQLIEKGDEASRPAAVRDLEAVISFGDLLPEHMAADATRWLEALRADSEN